MGKQEKNTIAAAVAAVFSPVSPFPRLPKEDDFPQITPSNDNLTTSGKH
jgi:hypothetical protein